MKKKVSISVLVVAVIIAAVIIGRNVYKENLKKNIDIHISSVSLIENPGDPTNEKYDLLVQYFNQKVGDICVYYDPEKEFSETQKSMNFDLNKYNVYQINIICNKQNTAEDKFVFAKLTEFCEESKYINVPCNLSSNICADNTLYYFVSKEYSEEDFKHYLKNTGIPIYTCIGKDELHPIVQYNQTIFFNQK